MFPFIFGAAFVLLMAAGTIGHTVLQNIMQRPINHVPLKLVSGLSVFAALLLIAWSFFVVPWWLPVATVVSSFFMVPIIYNMFHRMQFAGLMSFVLSALGVVLGLYSVFIVSTQPA